jgi:hypothetical protein
MDSAKEMEQPGPKKWLGIGARFLVTLFLLLLLLTLDRCGLADLVTDDTATLTSLPAEAYGTLRIEVLPQGAIVLVDGLRSGTTPVVLELAAGKHDVRVELDGYEPLDEAVNVTQGDEIRVGGKLIPLATPAGPTVTLIPTSTDEPPTSLPDLVVRYVKIELETGGGCDFTSTQLGTTVIVENVGGRDAGPFVVEVNGSQQSVEAGLAAGQTVSLWFEGYASGGETQVIVDAASQVVESDEGNNTFAQMVPIPTLPATCTPPPASPPTATSQPPSPPTATPQPPSSPAAVTLHEGQVTIPTYPYASFVTQAWNDALKVPYSVLDRGAYDASDPRPRDVSYRTLVVENQYLQLTFLPDIGGRLYEVLYKPTGHRVTYRNPVLKPSPWGPPEQGWWLAAGGIEWCLPVEEHGYEWGVPWKVSATGDGQSISVTLLDAGADVQDRVRARITVRLDAGAAYFTIQPRIENPTGAPLAVKYWTNAMLAPGGQNAPSADLRFVLPEAVTAVTVHSRGDDDLPGYNERMPWPLVNGVDLSRLGNWNRWLGVFEDPAAGDFVAVYDQGYDEGMVRVSDAGQAPGVKIVGFGWHDPIPSSTWTDDGSGYVELHSGPAATFDDSVTIPAGGAVQWTETWVPLAGLGGLRYANRTAALNLSAGGGQARIAVAVPRAWAGDGVLLLDGRELWRQALALQPGRPFQASVPLGDNVPPVGQLTLRLTAPDGATVAEYSARFALG